MEHNHEHHGEHHHCKQNNLAIPISIVIAGAIIALAIFASNKAPSTGAGEERANADVATIESVAKSIKINAKDLEKCMASDKYTSKITNSIAEAQATGGGGTPWSIVVTKSGQKYALSGAQPIESVKALIEKALKDVEKTSDTELNNLSPITSADHIRGDINAPVKIVEFSDIDCPFCKRFHVTMQEIMSTYGKDGKVAWVYRHSPLVQLHPDAANKAEAAECVAELGGNDKFWSFVDGLSK